MPCAVQGDEKLHVSLRQRVLDFIEQHEEDFAPFVEDDEPFAKYVARMRKVGVREGRCRAGPGNLMGATCRTVRFLGCCTPLMPLCRATLRRARGWED